MGKDRLTAVNFGSHTKAQLRPCNECDFDPAGCNQTYVVPVPGKDTDIMCRKFGIVEVIDLSALDKSVKISIPRKNGKPKTDSAVPAVAEAAV